MADDTVTDQRFQQMADAPRGAYYIVPSTGLKVAAMNRAARLQRFDLKIMAMSDLMRDHYGLEVQRRELVVDVSCDPFMNSAYHEAVSKFSV